MNPDPFLTGIEREYEQKLMPDGRFNVDGFLCVFDVSTVPNRNPEKQTELVAQIILNLVNFFHSPYMIFENKLIFFSCRSKQKSLLFWWPQSVMMPVRLE